MFIALSGIEQPLIVRLHQKIWKMGWENTLKLKINDHFFKKFHLIAMRYAFQTNKTYTTKMVMKYPSKIAELRDRTPSSIYIQLPKGHHMRMPPDRALDRRECLDTAFTIRPTLSCQNSKICLPIESLLDVASTSYIWNTNLFPNLPDLQTMITFLSRSAKKLGQRSMTSCCGNSNEICHHN